jgi:hypothetical protein
VGLAKPETQQNLPRAHSQAGQFVADVLGSLVNSGQRMTVIRHRYSNPLLQYGFKRRFAVQSSKCRAVLIVVISFHA